MKNPSHLTLAALTALFLGASHAHAEVNLGMTVGCPSHPDFLFPSITFTPFADAVVGQGAEFSVERTGSGVVVKHVGDAEYVRFPSIVSVSTAVDLILDHPGSTYCIDSAVATLGGTIKIVGSSASNVRVVSAVGSVDAD